MFCKVALFFAITLNVLQSFQSLNLQRHLKVENHSNFTDTELIVLSAHDDLNSKEWKYTRFCKLQPDTKICMEIGLPKNGSLYPKKLRISTANNLENTNAYPGKPRILRALRRNYDYYYRSVMDQPNPSSCQVPEDVKTAEIMCKIWPSSITCNLYCVYGTTYKEGIVRTTSCKYEDNKWSKEFEECKPFIDCKLKMATPGNIKCVGNEVLRNPACLIECERFEDKDELKPKLHSCKSHGSWEPALPFCVKLKGTSLVQAPEKTEHSKLTYP